MSPLRPEPYLWTPRKWALGIVLLFALQVALVYWLSDEPLVVAARPRIRTIVHFDTGPSLQPASPARDGSAEDDPMLFALVTPRSFSRTAWLTVPQFQYRPTNVTETPSWLGPPTEELADDFSGFVQTNLLSDSSLVARLPHVFTRVQAPVPRVVAQTSAELGGGLAGRVLASRDLPGEAEPILTNTVVRVVVGSDGATLSAALVSPSGVAKADQDALNFAKRARFADLLLPGKTRPPGPLVGLTFGTLTFRWFTVQWAEQEMALASADRGG